MANIIGSAVGLRFSQVNLICNWRTGTLLSRKAKDIYKGQQTYKEDVPWK